MMTAEQAFHIYVRKSGQKAGRRRYVLAANSLNWV